MEFKDHPVDASLAGWNDLCTCLENACASSSGKLTYKRTADSELLVQETSPPRSLRLEYSPDFRKVRYNAGISGWQEVSVAKPPQKPVVFETLYHQRYTVEEFCNFLLEQLDKSPF